MNLKLFHYLLKKYCQLFFTAQLWFYRILTSFLCSNFYMKVFKINLCYLHGTFIHE